MRLAE
jgi:hypothetical protein